MPEPKKPTDAYDAFNSVDALVKKPIVGSDGAASWQNFRKDSHKLFDKKTSSAPLAPLKKADKLGTGFTSWEQEREHEKEARKQVGEAAVGEGYTNFKTKNGQEEALARKEKKRIEKRIRPDSAEYFIVAKTFEGAKFDYVFTTKDRGTGYYWDGWDSVKRLNGELPADAGPSTARETQDSGKHERPASDEQEKTTEKKKKKRKKTAPVIVNDPNNPLEQVQEAIRKRNERLTMSNNDLPTGWEAATDPTNGNRVYYFNRQTGERQWEKPKKVEALPEGWNEAIDQKTSKKYFYHSSGETRWERPT